MKLRTLLLTAVVLLAGCNGKTPLYKDAGRSAEERADDLLKRMTVDEKLGQLLCPLGWPMYDKVSADSVTISDAYRDFIQNLTEACFGPFSAPIPGPKRRSRRGSIPPSPRRRTTPCCAMRW
ncbi:MAG: hypothetical protein J6P62_04265, partial [Bacteroidales bacterium]|nr:hypothetical protein [Bacteroidales bacterium]